MNVLLVGTKAPCTAEAGLSILILLPQLPECWDNKHAPPYKDTFFMNFLNVYMCMWHACMCFHV